MIVADALSVITARIYSSPRDFSGALLSLAAVAFAIQIYADFSGYSDMAVGLARILGYDLTINFRHPFFADSIAEFWRRWHISLSSWFRDYLYIPLGGNRVSAPVWALNIMGVFLVSGLWHGAGWHYVIWGAIHGLFMIVGRVTQPARELLAAWSGIGRFPVFLRFSKTALTFLLVTFAFIFFRAQSTADALYVASHFYRFGAFAAPDLLQAGLPAFQLAVTGIAALLLFVVEFLQSHPGDRLPGLWQARWVRWPAYAACFYSIVFFGVFDRIEFIYFQF
jgi:D-alanyl-lipoteichoic acid acyltransferase DltB (MBOAT superfamily)